LTDGAPADYELGLDRGREAFAGEDVDVARYFPEDERFLLELAPRLQHVSEAVNRAPTMSPST
jgi:hypothetical protein